MSAARRTRGAGRPAPRPGAELAARIQIPRRLPVRYDGQPLRHLSHSSYTKFLLCPDDWRRHYLKGERTPPSGHDVPRRARRRRPLHLLPPPARARRARSRSTSSTTPTATTGRASSPPNRPSAACDWDARARRAARVHHRPRGARAHARRARPAARPARRRPARARVRARARPGVDDPVLPRPRDAARQRRRGGEPVPAIVDYKVKSTLHSQAKADHDPQAGLYLAGRWLAGQPAEQFCFAQIGKPGKQRKTMSTALVVTRRTRRRAARDARADRAGRQPDRRALRALRPRRAVGVRRPERLEVLAALLRALRRAAPAAAGCNQAQHAAARARRERRAPAATAGSRASPWPSSEDGCGTHSPDRRSLRSTGADRAARHDAA